MAPIKPLTAEQVSALIEEQSLSREDLLDSLRQVMEIRALEDSISTLLTKGVLKGASHLYAGEEAVAVGAVAALRDDDLITSTHRGHGHAHAHGDKYAKTPEAKQEHYNKMMAEVMGKATGYCKGKGGSMHIADTEHGNLGATGIVGGNMPVAVGAALAQKLQGTDRVVVCFFGDGASNEGNFHESLNMASAVEPAGRLRGREQHVRHVRAVESTSPSCPTSPTAPAPTASPARWWMAWTCWWCARRSAGPPSGRAAAKGRR